MRHQTMHIILYVQCHVRATVTSVAAYQAPNPEFTIMKPETSMALCIIMLP
jgi:hypothetical protein